MKNQRHKRKEIYSVLMVSNTNGKSKQFQIAALTLRLCAGLLLLLLIVVGWLIYQTSMADGSLSVLRRQLAEQTKKIEELEAKTDALTKDKLKLTAENEALRQKTETSAAQENASEEAANGENAEAASALPSHFPSDGAYTLKPDKYTEEHPYISVSTFNGGHIVAAGDGTVTAVSSEDEIYEHIIEIEHEDGYKTRYLLHKEAEINVEEGAQVEAGTILMTITSDDTQLDYQVLLNGETIDPLSVIDAKG